MTILRGGNINESSNKDICFSALLQGCIILGFSFLGLLFLIQYFSSFQFYANLETYSIISIFCIFLFYFVRPGRKESETIIRLGVGIIVLITFLQRILMLIILPLSFGRADPGGRALRLYSQEGSFRQYIV